MTFKEKLLAVQTELKAPKDMYNKFGKFNYRSCESILEAVKPILKKYKLLLSINDDIVVTAGKRIYRDEDGNYITTGERIYVKATAVLIDAEEGNETISSVAFAREPDEKKGMDDSQVTGTASSYARKYALNALFLIDDTKDADTDEYREMTQNSKPQKQKTEEPKQQKAKKEEPKPQNENKEDVQTMPDPYAPVRKALISDIRDMLTDEEIPEEWICNFYGHKTLDDLMNSSLKTIRKRFKDFKEKYIEMAEFEAQQAEARGEEEYYENIVDMMGVER